MVQMVTAVEQYNMHTDVYRFVTHVLYAQLLIEFPQNSTCFCPHHLVYSVRTERKTRTMIGCKDELLRG